MQRIILVTGTPGVGKTELASRLADKTGSDFLNLSKLVKKERLHKGFDRSSTSYIMDELRVRNRLKHYFEARLGGGIVVETHTIGRFLPRRSGMIALVLRLDPVVLYKRLRARRWTKRKAWENVEAEIIDVSLFEARRFLDQKKVFEIDTTGKAHSVVLREALKIVSNKKAWCPARTDWLEKYDPVSLLRRL